VNYLLSTADDSEPLRRSVWLTPLRQLGEFQRTENEKKKKWKYKKHRKLYKSGPTNT